MRSVERNLADRIGAAAISTEIGCEREMRPREPVQRRKSGREPVASALQLRIEAATLEVTVQLEAKRRGARKLQPGKVPHVKCCRNDTSVSADSMDFLVNLRGDANASE